MTVSPVSSDVGVLSTYIETRIVSYTQGTLDESRAGYAQGVLSTIAGIVLTIVAAPYTTTVGGIILCVALQLGLVIAESSYSKDAQAELKAVYRYLVKEAQVLTDVGWSTYYTSISREVFRVEYGKFIDEYNYPHHYTFNYTPPYGYAPMNTQYAQNYNDNYMLASIARERYIQFMSPATENWAYTPPAPDPMRIVIEK